MLAAERGDATGRDTAVEALLSVEPAFAVDAAARLRRRGFSLTMAQRLGAPLTRAIAATGLAPSDQG